ncbi:MAG: hypothetical protein HZB51_22410 [Chloroflexi bacterium]|nr:hypothetical protein [Chloroflexota bacterium]
MLFLFDIAIVVLNLVALPIFVWILRRWSARAAMLFLGAMLVANVVVALDASFSIGGGFGAGTMIVLGSCFSAPLAVIPLSLFLFLRRKHFALAVGNDVLKRRLYLIGGIILIVLPFSPFVSHRFVNTYCDGQIEQTGNLIVQAMKKYRQDKGNYPATVSALVPTYLAQVPTAPSCLSKDNSAVKYEINNCSPDVVLLTARPSFDGAQVLRYNFQTDNWSGISFLDGACSFLR